jgi:uncharacterized damage-inducible protein DinB
MRAVIQLRRLAANNAWSNFRLLRACANLSAAEYEATRTSFFPSIPATLNHILIVDWYYYDGLVRGGRGRACFDPEEPFPKKSDFDAFVAAQREVDRKLHAFTLALETEAALDAKVELARADHVQIETVGDTLMHLFTHQIHHRGQVHAMLAGTSVKPPQLDEFFMSEELPLRREELQELGLPLE